jgi:DNA-directed RNA polymerase subunit RPC12/RpoP
MKAITCTQCGALIENVSDHSTIVDCEYCGARLILDELSAVKPKPLIVEPPAFEFQESGAKPLNPFPLVAGILIVIPIAALLLGLFKPVSKPTAKVIATPSTSPSTNSPVKLFIPPPSKPAPVVNYQPRVSWDGPDDIEHFEDPDVDISSVSDLTSEEVKNTVFKNRIVKLKVIINTEGEIDNVETISGHPLLVEAATASAKRSIFASRSKPTTRILTYTFRLLKD